MKLNLRKNSRFAVLLLLVAVLLIVLVEFREVLLPFALAALLAYLLAPVIKRLNRVRILKRQFPRVAAILLVYTLFLGLLTLGGFYIVPRFTSEVNKLARELPIVLQEVEQDWVVPLELRVNAWLAEILPPPPPPAPLVTGKGTPDGAAANGEVGDTSFTAAEPLLKFVNDYTYVVRRIDETRFEIIPKKRSKLKVNSTKPAWDFRGQISGTFAELRTEFESNLLEFLVLGRRYLVAIVSSFFATFLVLMISAFMLLDPERLKRFAISLVPAQDQAKYVEWMARLDRGLSGVVRGQGMICLINGALTGVGIALIGVPFVITLSLIATVFSLIPIFGVLISTVPILLMGLTVSFGTAVLALLWILAIHFLEGNFLNPKIMGDSAKIHPVLIIFALVVGEYVGGIFGALLAVPVFSLLQTSFLFLKSLAEQAEATS